MHPDADMLRITSLPALGSLQRSPKAGALVNSQTGQVLLESSIPWRWGLFAGRLSPEGVRVALPMVSLTKAS